MSTPGSTPNGTARPADTIRALDASFGSWTDRDTDGAGYYVIAATATYLDARLWTRNLEHFPMFPGLRAPY